MSSAIDRLTRSSQVKGYLTSAPPWLRPGMFANVELILSVRKDTLTVPEGAILSTPRGSQLIAVRSVGSDQVADFVKVTLGLRTRGLVEVEPVSGKLENKQLIVASGVGALILFPGANVDAASAQGTVSHRIGPLRRICMILSDLSIKRPVICLVASILILLVGVLSFQKLSVREYPTTDTPIVTVNTGYVGASAEVMESKITEPLEKEISSIDGIQVLRSSSSEQSSGIAIEFDLSRDVDEAANDVRDRVSRARRRLPPEVREPQVSKVDADASPILNLAFTSDRYSRLELNDIADRLAVQRIQTLPGVGAVDIYGPRYAMRMWVNTDRLAAYGLTAADVERALRQQNVEIPGGRIESTTREFTVRVQGNMAEGSDFRNLVLATRGNYQVKFSDVGRVELGPNDYRNGSYFNGKPAVTVAVQRQAQANLMDLAERVMALLPQMRLDAPPGVKIDVSYDTSVFVARSVHEVYTTLYEASALVILMIFLFLRDWRATLIPLLAIPVSIVGTYCRDEDAGIFAQHFDAAGPGAGGGPGRG